MSTKLVKLVIVSAASLMLANLSGVSAETYADHGQARPELLSERIKAGLDKLRDRLEIKPSQQAVWEAYENSVESLAEGKIRRPEEDADAAAIARYRADKAEAFARKFERIADATAKLESALDENQRKILDGLSRRMLEKSEKMRRRMGERERSPSTSGN